MGKPIVVLNCGSSSIKAVLRERVCRALGWLGIDIDEEANRANAPTISRASSRVRIAVEPTNEEWVAASHALRAIR